MFDKKYWIVAFAILLLPSLAHAAPCYNEMTFTGTNTQGGRIWRDAIPSTCLNKSYPGIYNPGTTYNYETFTFTNTSASAVCVTISFDPNTGATPCGTNAHASAYQDSYNPASQSTNFLGDVGSSITDDFSVTVAGSSDLVIAVTNTSSQSACTFSVTPDSSVSCSPPPTLTASLNPSSPTAGQAGALNFLIDNSLSTDGATGLTLTSTLPTGLLIANPANTASTCTGGSFTATPGTGSFSYSGGSLAAGGTCTVSVDVIASTPGSYTVDASLGSNLGSDSSSITFSAANADPTPVPALSDFGVAIFVIMLGAALVATMRRANKRKA